MKSTKKSAPTYFSFCFSFLLPFFPFFFLQYQRWHSGLIQWEEYFLILNAYILSLSSSSIEPHYTSEETILKKGVFSRKVYMITYGSSKHKIEFKPKVSFICLPFITNKRLITSRKMRIQKDSTGGKVLVLHMTDRRSIPSISWQSPKHL